MSFSGSAPVAAAAAPAVSNQSAGLALGGDFAWYSATKRNAALDQMAAAGAKWIRLDVAWSQIERTRGSYTWEPFTSTIDAARARGLEVVAILAYTPSWARPAGTTDKFGPTDPTAFADFAAAAAAQFAPRGVHVFEIWNEPNIPGFWGPKPSVADYTRLLRAAYPRIHAVDPNAIVLTGGTSPASDAADGSTVAPATFLRGIYANGGAGSFDAVAHHPYSFPYAPSNPGSWNAFGQTATLHQVVADNGDGAKLIWGTEIGAPTSGSGAVTEDGQVALFNEATDLWAQWSFTGPLLWYRWDDNCTNTEDRECWFGMTRADGTAKPMLDAFRARHAAAAAPTTTAPPTTAAPTTAAPTTAAPTTAPPTTVAPTTTAPPTTVAPSTTTTTVAPTALAAPYDPATDPRVTDLRTRALANEARYSALVRLYRGILGRIPDRNGLDNYQRSLDRGTAITTIANNMATSSEFRSRYGKLNNTDFVKRIYLLTLGRQPTTTELTAALAQFTVGKSRGVVAWSIIDAAAGRSAAAARVEAVAAHLTVKGVLPTPMQDSGYAGTGTTPQWRLARLAGFVA